jgi:hypothetical protein
MSIAQAIEKDAEQKAFLQRMEYLRNQARETSESDKLKEEIIGFFKSQGIWSGLGVDILNEATREIFFREREGFFTSRAPDQMELAKLIRSTEPADDFDWGDVLVDFCKPLTWLLTWACRRYPVYELLDTAFSKAIHSCHETQIVKPLALNSGYGVDKTYLLEHYVRESLDDIRRSMSLGLSGMMPKDHPFRLAAKAKAKQ